MIEDSTCSGTPPSAPDATETPAPKFWTPERLAKSARGLPTSWPTPDGSKLSADQLKETIRSWLDAQAEPDAFAHALFGVLEYADEEEPEPPAVDLAVFDSSTWQHARFRFFRDISDRSRIAVLKDLGFHPAAADECTNHGHQGLAIDQLLRKAVAAGREGDFVAELTDAIDRRACVEEELREAE